MKKFLCVVGGFAAGVGTCALVGYVGVSKLFKFIVRDRRFQDKFQEKLIQDGWLSNGVTRDGNGNHWDTVRIINPNDPSRVLEFKKLMAEEPADEHNTQEEEAKDGES